MTDALAAHLARRARELGLGLPDLEEADPQALRDFARAALHELAALGLMPGDGEVGCWARPRPGGH